MPTTPRIAPLDTPLPDTLQQRMDRLLPRGMPVPQLFLTVARNEALFNAMVDMDLIGPTGLFNRRTLPSALRELIILRTCTAARNGYEYNLHVQTISERMGLLPSQIEDLAAAEVARELWSPAERVVIRLVDELVATLDVGDETFAAAREHFDEATLIEITHLVGLYTGVAMLAALARPRYDHYRR